MKISIAEVNALEGEGFVSLFGAVFEDSPWVAARAWAQRPFADRGALLAVLIDSVRAAGVERQMELIRAHPDLVGKAAREGRLGAASTSEQAGAGLDQLGPQAVKWFQTNNAAYQEKFGFPFIICVRANKKQSIVDGLRVRLLHSPEQERAAALAEIEKIAAFRLADLVEG